MFKKILSLVLASLTVCSGCLCAPSCLAAPEDMLKSYVACLQANNIPESFQLFSWLLAEPRVNDDQEKLVRMNFNPSFRGEEENFYSTLAILEHWRDHRKNVIKEQIKSQSVSEKYQSFCELALIYDLTAKIIISSATSEKQLCQRRGGRMRAYTQPRFNGSLADHGLCKIFNQVYNRLGNAESPSLRNSMLIAKEFLISSEFKKFPDYKALCDPKVLSFDIEKECNYLMNWLEGQLKRPDGLKESFAQRAKNARAVNRLPGAQEILPVMHKRRIPEPEVSENPDVPSLKIRRENSKRTEDSVDERLRISFLIN